MSQSRCTDPAEAPAGSWPAARRRLLLGLLLAPLAACGRKGGLELPPPEPYGEGDDDPVSNPDTYGDPFTFPEPGEDEESAE